MAKGRRRPEDMVDGLDPEDGGWHVEKAKIPTSPKPVPPQTLPVISLMEPVHFDIETLLDLSRAWDLFGELEQLELAKRPDGDQETVDWAILEEFSEAIDRDRAEHGPRRLFDLIEWSRGGSPRELPKGANKHLVRDRPRNALMNGEGRAPAQRVWQSQTTSAKSI